MLQLTLLICICLTFSRKTNAVGVTSAHCSLPNLEELDLRDGFQQNGATVHTARCSMRELVSSPWKATFRGPLGYLIWSLVTSFYGITSNPLYTMIVHGPCFNLRTTYANFLLFKNFNTELTNISPNNKNNYFQGHWLTFDPNHHLVCGIFLFGNFLK